MIFIAVAAGLYYIYRATLWEKELKIEEELKNVSDHLRARRGNPDSHC